MHPFYDTLQWLPQIKLGNSLQMYALSQGLSERHFGYRE